MKHFAIWDAASMAWTEIGLGREDYPRIARELRANYATWDEVDRIILRDVLGSFSLESSLFPLALVPVIGFFLIAPLPDWGYEAKYLQDRMSRWYRLPSWQHFLNPLRIIGYPIAYLVSFNLRRKLRAAYLALRA